eukprot:Gregarina_sp_Poly_1__11516@NODE_999_length_5423_cov_682_617625_g701_i0_p3_GENE_NODE_999_length_5423_cov_682_617625_g701_i0NODE_999_length_5423_cov_682_617625_g701_i0_p3_ORF_typecomplete_len317_score28_07_NODE_999_length_5423_cov_682_617625_g701_i028503800
MRRSPLVANAVNRFSRNPAVPNFPENAISRHDSSSALTRPQGAGNRSTAPVDTTGRLDIESASSRCSFFRRHDDAKCRSLPLDSGGPRVHVGGAKVLQLPLSRCGSIDRQVWQSSLSSVVPTARFGAGDDSKSVCSMELLDEDDSSRLPSPGPKRHKRRKPKRRSSATSPSTRLVQSLRAAAQTAVDKILQAGRAFGRTIQQQWGVMEESFFGTCQGELESEEGPCLRLFLPNSTGQSSSEANLRRKRKIRHTPTSRIPQMIKELEEEGTLLESRCSSVASVTHLDAPPPSALFYEQYCRAAARSEVVPKPPHLAS